MDLLERKIQQSIGNPKFQFKRYSQNQIDEWNARLRSAFNSDGIQVRNYNEEEQEFVHNELQLCKLDFKYWAERYCTISSDQGRLEKLTLRTSQQKMLDIWARLEESNAPLPIGKIAVIVAKARRVGATVLAEAAVAHGCMLRSQAAGLIASDIPQSSLKLFQIQDRIYKNLPPWMKPQMTGKVKSEHYIFDKLDSDIQVGHGSQKNPMGQGVRLDFIHLTEVSTWMDVAVQQIDEDILPAFISSHVPSSLWVMESTGRVRLDSDMGQWFKTEFYKAKRGEGRFRSVFLSWYDAPEMHSEDSTGIELKESTKLVAERIKLATGFECSKNQLVWYQRTREHYESKGDLSSFISEYPTDADECFTFGQPSAWKIEIIDTIRNAARPPAEAYDMDFRRRKMIPLDSWDDDPKNRVLIFEKKKKGFNYVIGCDAAYGVEGQDSASVQVNRVGDIHSPDKLVAEFWGICQPDELAAVIWCLGHYFFDDVRELPALVAVEINGPGLTTQTELIKWGYSNLYRWRLENRVGGGITERYGWQTTQGTRPLLTKSGVEAIKKGELIICSPFFADEMKTFINYGWKRRSGVDGWEYFAHAPGATDDRIFAGFIAFYVSHDYDHVDIADERRRLRDLETAKKTKKLKNYQEIDIAIEEMEEGFDESQEWL